MLTITEKAAKKLIATRESTGAPDSYGVRLSVAMPQGSDQPSLAVNFTPEAQPGDEVTQQSGLTTYVASEIAPALAKATLDVSAEDGTERLVLTS